MATSSNDSTLSMNNLLHSITIRLSPNNYLLWRNQMIPLFAYQDLTDHIDGSRNAPPMQITTDGNPSSNPAYTAWLAADRCATIILNASLTEEAVAETIGSTTARQIWSSLEAAYSNTSVERVHHLKDILRTISKGSESLAEYNRRFKSYCDQLAAIGNQPEEAEKRHWYLCGLGASFEGFSTAIRASGCTPSLRELMAQAESHDSFLKSIHASSIAPVVFTAESSNRNNTRGNFRSNRGGRNGGRGRGRRPPHCQLCRTDGHYANQCPSLAQYATKASPTDSDIAKAFHAQCNIGTPIPDWFVDTGATDHMTNNPDVVPNATPFHGPGMVTFGNGGKLPITHIGSTTISPNDRLTRRVMAQGRCDNGLYILDPAPQAFVAVSQNKASFELWHQRLGHVSYDTISTLNNDNCLFVTSLLPKPILCSACEMAKSSRLPFPINNQRALNILDLVHCDLWGPSPVTSHDGYRYYVLFVDDHSRFTWLYPLRAKSEFHNILGIFLKLVQTQFSTKLKTLQTDGGTEFLNQHVRRTLQDNGTFHRISCPYTPQQNGRVERKHRHVVETGLAMMFNSCVPSTYWVEAFSTAVYIINRLPTKVLESKSPFELVFSRKPTYNNLRTFGCRVYPYLRDYAQHKLSPRSLPCIFLGYSSQYKGYCCLEPSTSRLYISRHAKFEETQFPFASNTLTTDTTNLPLSTFLEEFTLPKIPSVITKSAPLPPPKSPCTLCMDPSPTHIHTTNDNPNPTTPTSPNTESPTPQTPTSPSTTSDQPPSPLVNDPLPSSDPQINIPQPQLHPMQTRSRSGIFKPKYPFDTSHYALHSSLLTSNDPKSFKTASSNPRWMDAMKQELDALSNLLGRSNVYFRDF
ncbi:hypothetical protein QVD17_40643 [Tagetes erecta]|uniref:Integrase catalytic domain-containing protein n=1 Tax=Tagetes erecta TaxID=13708 RepID=A0AAD8JQ61_TARER|nr:hypothetical protein QVD17_40643 [Tagetes erecta]